MPPTMPRPRSKTLTPAEVTILTDWRDLVFEREVGATDALAAEVGVTRQHLSQCLNGSRRPSRALWARIVERVMATSVHHIAMLERKGSPQTQAEISTIRRTPREAPPVAGRGRAALVGGIA